MNEELEPFKMIAHLYSDYSGIPDLKRKVELTRMFLFYISAHNVD